MYSLRFISRQLIGLVLVFAMGCAEDISPTDGPMGDGGMDGPASRIESTENENGITRTRADASDPMLWVYFDLESGEEVSTDTPEDDASWDLAFQRVKIKSNGGMTGSGDVQVARVDGADFDELTQAPSTGYVSDSAEDGDDDDSDPDYAFHGDNQWYDYNPSDHQITPNDAVFVVKTVEGNYYKVKLVFYYDEAGTSGFPAFEWGAIEAPSGEPMPEPEPEPMGDEFVVDASGDDEWVYVDVLSRQPVSTANPAASARWDLAFNGTMVQTNSGSTTSGDGGALLAEGMNWDEVESTDTVGFQVDETLPIPGPPGSGEFSGNPVLNSWYDYNAMTHEVTAKDAVFIVRTADGEYAKLQFLNYEDGVFTLRSTAIERVAQTHSTTLDASNADAFVYFDFESGEVIEPTDATMNLEWDIALSRTQVQTNSGTSGNGDGGAVDPGAMALDDVAAVPDGSGCYLINDGHRCDCALGQTQCEEATGVWTPQCACEAEVTVDEILPIPGPPGSGEYSGNPALAEWYNYDPMSHEVSPKEAAYLVKTATGAFAKFQFLEYSDGTIGIDWVFAGPQQTNF